MDSAKRNSIENPSHEQMPQLPKDDSQENPLMKVRVSVVGLTKDNSQVLEVPEENLPQNVDEWRKFIVEGNSQIFESEPPQQEVPTRSGGSGSQSGSGSGSKSRNSPMSQQKSAVDIDITRSNNPPSQNSEAQGDVPFLKQDSPLKSAVTKSSLTLDPAKEQQVEAIVATLTRMISSPYAIESSPKKKLSNPKKQPIKPPKPIKKPKSKPKPKPAKQIVATATPQYSAPSESSQNSYFSYQQNPNNSYPNFVNQQQIGVMPPRAACFQAPFVPFRDLNNCPCVEDEEDGMNFSFNPDGRYTTEVTFCVEPRKKPMWQTMMNVGFNPVIYCSVPPCCLPGNGNNGQPNYNYGPPQYSQAQSSSDEEDTETDSDEGETSEEENDEGPKHIVIQNDLVSSFGDGRSSIRKSVRIGKESLPFATNNVDPRKSRASTIDGQERSNSYESEKTGITIQSTLKVNSDENEFSDSFSSQSTRKTSVSRRKKK